MATGAKTAKAADKKTTDKPVEAVVETAPEAVVETAPEGVEETTPETEPVDELKALREENERLHREREIEALRAENARLRGDTASLVVPDGTNVYKLVRPRHYGKDEAGNRCAWEQGDYILLTDEQAKGPLAGKVEPAPGKTPSKPRVVRLTALTK